MRHPQHEEVAQTIQDWFHLPFEEMGYRAEKRSWGTYWSTDHVHTLGVPLGEVEAFLADVRAYYGDRPVRINLAGASLDAELGPALCKAGCLPGKIEIFLAHVGSVAAPPSVSGLCVEAVDEANIERFARIVLEAFAGELGAMDLAQEIARRRAELTGTGRGLLARIDGEPAGILWRYDEAQDTWINLLGMRPSFQRRGIGRRLLCHTLLEAYGRGCRSVLINVLAENERAMRLYRRLGFVDQVYWRHRYLLEP